jgi:5-methylcytosine-specific restriction endonuclease McrA
LKPYTKLYLDFFGYDISDFIPCEICHQKAVDIHHIERRGMGGTNQDKIENLMSLCRKCHIEKGDKKQFKEELKTIHNKLLNIKK